MIKKEPQVKPKERIIVKEPEKPRQSSGSLGALVGLIGLLAGIYAITQGRLHNFTFKIPDLWTNILLVLASLYLILESGKRMALIRAKRKFDHLMHQ